VTYRQGTWREKTVTGSLEEHIRIISDLTQPPESHAIQNVTMDYALPAMFLSRTLVVNGLRTFLVESAFEAADVAADGSLSILRMGKAFVSKNAVVSRAMLDNAAPKGPLTGTYRGRTINVEINKINIRNGKTTETGSGIEYAWRNHGSLLGDGPGQLSKSKFSISKDRVKEILRRRDVVTSPVRQSGTTGNYIREVDVGEIVGHLPLNKGGDLTSVMTIITDIKGNIVNVFPGLLGRGATLP
jgi:filamentous hemagglutinin